ncbi:MAG: LacI family DNA-binding transcriptional regulator [Treponemataceae bacterium]
MKDKTSTMETVALKAGVSISTVSHVINKTRNVNQETRQAVMSAIKDLKYNTTKRENQKIKNKICIGVILADAREDYYITMIKAIESLTNDYDVSIIFSDSEVSRVKEEKNIKMLLDKKIDGLILAPSTDENVPELLKNISIPVILVDRQYLNHNYLSVGINNFQSAYNATKLLLNKNVNNIGYVGYQKSATSTHQRVLGYKTALIDFSTKNKPIILQLKYKEEDSFPLIKNFIIENQIDGIICATSTLCYELIAVLDTLDGHIQNNLKIMTFDDNKWFDYLKYPVSVISQPVAEIANAAVENLLHMIENPLSSYAVKRELFFETTIIER